MDRHEAHIRLRDTAIAREFNAAFDHATKATWLDGMARKAATERFAAAHNAYCTALNIAMGAT